MPKNTCSIEHCERPNFARFLCRRHYDRARLTGELPRSYRVRPPQGRCEREGCGSPLKARGLCAVHYNAERERSNVPCSVAGCPRPALSRGWCRSHYSRWKRHGDPVATPVWGDLTADTPDGMRLCRTCGQFAPLDQFRRRIDRPGAPHASKCRPCVTRSWQENRERHLAAKAAQNYGIDASRYLELVSGSCHVCGGQNTQSGRRLHIDHCHTTGKIRGALCHACNTALGLAGESIERLLALAEYLEHHTAG